MSRRWDFFVLDHSSFFDFFFHKSVFGIIGLKAPKPRKKTPGKNGAPPSVPDAGLTGQFPSTLARIEGHIFFF